MEPQARFTLPIPPLPEPYRRYHLPNPDDQEPLESTFSRLTVGEGGRGGAFLGALSNLDDYSLLTSTSVGGGGDGFYLTSSAVQDNDDNYWLSRPVMSRNGLRRGVSSQQYGMTTMNHGNLYSSRRKLWSEEPPVNCLSLGDLRGKVLILARDQYGCRFLQRAIESMTNEAEIKMVYDELIDHVCELMLDPFGNYVVQKLVGVCSEDQRTRILLMVTKNDYQLVSICLNMHGTRVVQKLLHHITTPEQVSIVLSALAPGAVALTKDMNGHNVIQDCLKYFSEEDNKYLLNEVADNCFPIATDKSGCCVLQQCVEYSKGEARTRLVAEIIANAVPLAEDQYGNYVVQHLLGLRVPQITENLLRHLKGSYTALSCNKYGSNVVEKCLSESHVDQSAHIIMELLTTPGASMLLFDPYGNYVIQSALSVAKGFPQTALLDLVHVNLPMMRSNMYGKKVIARVQRMGLLCM